MDEEDGTGQGFRINDDEDEREIKEQRRCLQTVTYYSSSPAVLSSNANDGPSANQSQAEPQQLVPLLKRKYDDLEPPTVEEDGKLRTLHCNYVLQMINTAVLYILVRKSRFPPIEFVDLTGDSDDESLQTWEKSSEAGSEQSSDESPIITQADTSVKIGPTNPEVTLIVATP